MVRGLYCLIINLRRGLAVGVGRLGVVYLEEGVYVYIGSGRGPGGVRKRVLRHCLRGKKPFWHIDYLTVSEFVDVAKAIAVHDDTLSESFLARLIGTDECFEPAVEGFGCSDLRSDKTHLYKFTCASDVVNHIISKLAGGGVPPSKISLIDACYA